MTNKVSDNMLSSFSNIPLLVLRRGILFLYSVYHIAACTCYPQSSTFWGKENTPLGNGVFHVDEPSGSARLQEGADPLRLAKAKNKTAQFNFARSLSFVSHLRDLNPKPATYDAAALPIELRWRTFLPCSKYSIGQPFWQTHAPLVIALDKKLTAEFAEGAEI